VFAQHLLELLLLLAQEFYINTLRIFWMQFEHLWHFRTAGNHAGMKMQNGGYIVFIQSLNGVSDKGFVKMKYYSNDFLAPRKGIRRA
jgi:hypothetical protein